MQQTGRIGRSPETLTGQVTIGVFSNQKYLETLVETELPNVRDLI